VFGGIDFEKFKNKLFAGNALVAKKVKCRCTK